jgi:hypothetical protein
MNRLEPVDPTGESHRTAMRFSSYHGRAAFGEVTLDSIPWHCWPPIRRLFPGEIHAAAALRRAHRRLLPNLRDEPTHIACVGAAAKRGAQEASPGSIKPCRVLLMRDGPSAFYAFA